jgi:type IV secretion system protein VirB9
MKLILTVCLLILPFLSTAQQIPESYHEDSHIKHITFQANNVVRLKAKTFITTQILFEKEEAVITVEGGDTSGWIVTYHDNLPNMIFIKPTQLNSNTNMTVVTNKHNYYFQIISNQAIKSDSTQSPYAIKFDYPEEERAKKEAQQKEKQLQKESRPKQQKPKSLNEAYRFSGNTQIIPVHVYDDGRFTYFELSPNQPVPAIFAVNDKEGKEAIVNLRRQGNTLIVQRLAPQFTLRNGGLVASVFNTQEINRIKQGRR